VPHGGAAARQRLLFLIPFVTAATTATEYIKECSTTTTGNHGDLKSGRKSLGMSFTQYLRTTTLVEDLNGTVQADGGENNHARDHFFR